MKKEQSYTYTVHQYFYVETQSGRKPHNYFSYMSSRITFIGRNNLFCSPATTGRRFQPPIFLRYNPREDKTPQLYGYNQKEDTTPYVLRIQPKGGYNHLSLPHISTLKYKCQMKKPLPHYHYEIYHCKPIPTSTTDL
jgi:hypothetical protein